MATALCLLLAFQTIYPEDHGLFRPDEISSVNRVGGHWLLCSTMGDKLLLFSDQGEKVAVWERAGQGPGELSKPYVMGVAENRIYVATIDGRALAFDARLRWLEDVRLPRLQFGQGHFMTASFRVGEGEFLVLAMVSAFAPLAKHVALKEDRWAVAGEYFPQKLTREIMRATGKTGAAASQIACHDRWLFYVPEGFQEPRYEIQVYRYPDMNEGQAVLALANQAEAYEPILGVYAMISAVAKLPRGWIVEAMAKKNGENIYVHDYFDEAGKFVQRAEASSETKLHPVVNGPGIMIWRGDEEPATLAPFEPAWRGGGR